jgi:RNA polymerase sigma factor (TIGR02999 family)
MPARTGREVTTSSDEERARVERLVSANYEDLRRIAHARLFRSGKITLLQTSDLVNETYLRLARIGNFAPRDRAHFLAYAARAIRSIIVDYVRERNAQRRGGDALHVTLDTGLAMAPIGEEEILRIDAALEELRGLDDALASVVEMRFFAGMSEIEIATALGVSDRTIRRHWEKARLLLAAVLADD